MRAHSDGRAARIRHVRSASWLGDSAFTFLVDAGRPSAARPRSPAAACRLRLKRRRGACRRSPLRCGYRRDAVLGLRHLSRARRFARWPVSPTLQRSRTLAAPPAVHDPVEACRGGVDQLLGTFCNDLPAAASFRTLKLDLRDAIALRRGALFARARIQRLQLARPARRRPFLKESRSTSSARSHRVCGPGLGPLQ